MIRGTRDKANHPVSKLTYMLPSLEISAELPFGKQKRRNNFFRPELQLQPVELLLSIAARLLPPLVSDP